MAALLSAIDQDLGGCFFGIPTDRIAAVRETFGVPPSQLSVGVISIGYPESAPDTRHGPVEGRIPTGPPRITGSPARRPRKAPSELIHRGVW